MQTGTLADEQGTPVRAANIYLVPREKDAEAWRQNLTLVNACTFADRWAADLRDIPVQDDLVVLA